MVPPAEFGPAVRLRLGAPCVPAGAKCCRCNAVLDAPAAHCLTCALPEATRAHYEVRNHVLALTHLADPSAEAETLGLIPSMPTLRPADILSSAAIPGRSAALDIGITSPDASGSGDDCCAAMFRRKCQDYSQFEAELLLQGIVYRPMVFSAFGRAHPETQLILETLAVQAARRRGLQDHKLILRRTYAAIGVEIARRGARMVSACLPHLAEHEVSLLLGETSSHAVSFPERRAVALAAGDAEAVSGSTSA